MQILRLKLIHTQFIFQKIDLFVLLFLGLSYTNHKSFALVEFSIGIG